MTDNNMASLDYPPGLLISEYKQSNLLTKDYRIYGKYILPPPPNYLAPLPPSEKQPLSPTSLLFTQNIIIQQSIFSDLKAPPGLIHPKEKTYKILCKDPPGLSKSSNIPKPPPPKFKPNLNYESELFCTIPIIKAPPYELFKLLNIPKPPPPKFKPDIYYKSEIYSTIPTKKPPPPKPY